MLPTIHKIVFFLFALVAGGFGAWGFWRLYLRVRRGAPSTETRFDRLPERLGYALRVSLTQERTFRRRPWISTLHAFIFYGFVYYLLVNVVDGLEGYFHFSILSSNPLGAVYNVLADVLSFLVLVGVIGLVIRRFGSPSKRDFRFTEKTPIHPLIKQNYIARDGLIVSSFITFHVGSRILGNAAKMVAENREFGHYDAFQPFSSALGSALFGGLSDRAVEGWRIFGFWGALGSVLAFLSYFPYTKHIHIFMAPLNYALKRPVGSGVLPPMKGLEEAMEAEEPKLGAEKLEDLEWPRLLDAYSCIQCNRCQDVCPANATGKALSPAALEINKRMELNVIASHPSPFTLRPAAYESGASTAHPLLEFAINEESVWACTTCGACMQVCPVQDEQMLDIIDIRRHQVMVAGEFPAQLQTAFRGMERTSNPWGISRDKRLEWAEGLKVPTIEENPEPDVIYWVGCAAAYDPGAQKVARSFVQLLDKAGVNYAVLGKKEACTGDSARRSGNEFLYQTLAAENVETLNTVRPKLIVATCPHCMNAIGHEYKQLGGDYRTVHHTEYLETLVAAGQLPLTDLGDHVTYHDPCYLGRHNGVYDAPRNLISKMAGEVLSLERERDNSFCCGAGGAQFWKEEEEGRERVSDNRFRELQTRLDTAAEASAEFERSGKVVAVGCPFCKSMLNSTPEKQKRDDIVVKDVAELMLESMQKATGVTVAPTGPDAGAAPTEQPEVVSAPNAQMPMHRTGDLPAAGGPELAVGETGADVQGPQPGSPVQASADSGVQPEAQAAHPEAAARKSWKPKRDDVAPQPAETTTPVPDATPTRKSWKPKAAADDVVTTPVQGAPAAPTPETTGDPGARKAWKPKAAQTEAAPSEAAQTSDDVAQATPTPQAQPDAASARKAWKPKAAADDVSAAPVTLPEPAAPAPVAAPAPETAAPRKAWAPKARAEAPAPAVSPALSTEGAEGDMTPAPAVAATDPVQAPPSQTPERKKWAPRAAAQAEAASAPAPVTAPPVTPSTAGADAAPAEALAEAVAPAPGSRPKWTPKARTDAAPATPAAATALPEQEPITEHVHLEQVGENLLEEGARATSEPGAGGRKKWTPKKKA
ncbi:heterodisulfide reductase-related iron-sulfur binding cluster [Deinococcus sp. Leaf326]|uniref:heterodisulfide reductase-related iron-sulfur binding cluster n=1 Tax=Deinococcus sp. Leaf326 TaxID=1736338 RepID=UPI0006F3792E|nr:heterodisulfide reductase-related iron-sulfur binding cluster [Deinococcus sp. Leaf326]KQR41061.1 [Fe-S]-binding protein [Deinococcus sp. Leaf326]